MHCLNIENIVQKWVKEFILKGFMYESYCKRIGFPKEDIRKKKLENF